MRKKVLLLGLCFFMCFCLINVARLWAETGDTGSVTKITGDVSAKDKGEKKNYFIEVNIETEYNSNVFSYSRDEKAEYEAYTNINRFKGVNSLDDFTTRISLNAGLEKKIFDIGATVFDVGMQANIYAVNEDKNYEVYDISVKQRMGKNNLIEVGYEYLPKYFVRTLYDSDLLVGDRYRKAEFENNSVYVKYWNRPSNFLTWWIQYTYGKKDYNADFNERDTQSHEIDLSLGYKPFAWIKFNPRFTYTLNDAKGTDNDASVDPDISQNKYRLGIYIELFPKNKLSYLLGYNFYWVDYTTDNAVADDPYHAGRSDEVQRIECRVNYALKNNVELYVGYQYEIRDAKVAGFDPTPREESILGYDEHLIKGGLSIKF